MKTNATSYLSIVFPLSLCLALAGCGSARKDAPETSFLTGTAKSALDSGHWKRVSENPPTYFPKELPSDHPTNYNHGSWVYSGDAKGTRFFVPVRGDQAHILEMTAEAEAAMTPEARDELAQKRKDSHKKRKGRQLTGGLMSGLAGIFQGVGEVAAHEAAHNAPHYNDQKKVDERLKQRRD